MRRLSKFFLILTFTALLIPLQTGDALSAAPLPKALKQRMDDFDALAKDSRRGGRRDLWLALEESFAALNKQYKGQHAATAAYYEARSRQELAARSWLEVDHKEAEARFRAVAATYADFQEAPEAMLRQADELDQHLKNRPAAIAVLQRLIKIYPRNSLVPQARQKLAAMTEQKSDSPPAKAATTTAQSDKRGNPPSVSLKSIRWKNRGRNAVITLELDTATSYDVAFTPPDKTRKIPGRLHLDLSGASLSDRVKPGMKPKNLLVTRIRASHAGNGLRVTLDCDGIRCYAVKTPPGKPQIIEVEVSEEDIAGGAQVAESAAPRGKTGSRQASRPRSKESVMEQLGLTVRTIMLDAGHGGKDPGAIAGQIEEARFTLAMAKRVGALLKKEGFTVIYTRTNNTYIPLQNRPDKANQQKADLFISIHANANPNADVHGIETYFLDSAKTQDAAVVAARENAVSVRNISDLQVILTDLMLSSKLAESRHLAKCVQGGIVRNLRGAKYSPLDNGYRSAPFYVLMGARMPAVLVEFGYVTNEDEAARLRNERYLQLQAEGLVRGIKQYKNELADIAGN